MAASATGYFAIFAAMRSGSNLLEKSLEQYEGIEVHGELFNPSFIGKAGAESYCGITLEDREKNPARLIEAIRGSGLAIPGFRIFDGHDMRIEEKCLADPACAKVILQRDPVESYVSLKAARATNQWMLRPAAKRNAARVTFDAEEFNHYHEANQAFYRRLRRGLQVSGQSAFFLRYEDLQDRDILDGLARYLGVAGIRREEKVPIRRQNPESLSDRVENFAEMGRTLDAMGLIADVLPFDCEPHRGPSIGRMTACRTVPILLAVIPGCSSQAMLNWMRSVDRANDDVQHPLLKLKNQKELNLWLSQKSGTLCLSIARHPLNRAYDVFMRRIFFAGYPAIRRRLERHFGLELPAIDNIAASPDALAASGYGIAQHRRAFAGFLEFVRANLAGQTGMRTDAEWASQVSHLEGFGSVIPLSRVIREADLIAELAHVAHSMGLPKPSVSEDAVEAQSVFTLADVYDKSIEKLGRKAYAKDFLKLGFEDWSPVQ